VRYWDWVLTIAYLAYVIICGVALALVLLGQGHEITRWIVELRIGKGG